MRRALDRNAFRRAQSGDPSRECYVQLFRDGGIEAVTGMVADPEKKTLAGTYWEEKVIGAFGRYGQFWDSLEVTGHLAIGLALSGMADVKILYGSDFFGDHDERIDRDLLIVPEVLVERSTGEADKILRPLFDVLSNAGGWGRSLNYDPEGRRKKPRA